MKLFEGISEKSIKYLVRFAVSIIVVYFIAAGLLFYLAHDQLFYKDTQGLCEFPGAEYAITEVCKGVEIRQDFAPGMNMISGVNVQIATYLRENIGTLTLELYDADAGYLIKRVDYNMRDLADLSFVGIYFDEPYFTDGHYLSLRIFSGDSEPGFAVAPMVKTVENDSTEINSKGVRIREFFVNGEKTPCRLGMYVDGKQTLWVGPYYSEIVLIGFIIIVLLVVVIYGKIKKDKVVVSFTIIDIFSKYSFLISQLVGKSFKTKYKRSVLGVFWSFLNPLLTMIVQYFVFSNLFRFNIANYHIYLLIGITFYSFFSVGVSRSVWSIIGHAQLIKKVYVPKWIYPFSEVLSSFVDFAISIIPLFILICFSGIKYSKTMWLVIFPLLCILMFTVGFGILLSALMVYFRDTEHIWGVLSMVWMYGTPIFYSMDILPEGVDKILMWNPLYMYIDFVRTCVMKGISPYPVEYVKCAVSATLMFIIGTKVFKKLQDGFLLRI